MSFSNFKVVDGYDVRLYVKSEFNRGDKRFVMSRSNLMRFANNPRKWLATGAKEEETASTEFGSLVDCLALEPQTFKERYEVCPAEYIVDTKRCPTCESVADAARCSKCKTDRIPHEVKKDWNRNATYCSEWQSKHEANGKSVVTKSVFDSAQTAVEKLFSFEEIKELIGCSKKQVYISADWTCKRTGVIVPVKALLDLVPDKNHKQFGCMIPDLKTSRCAEQWDRTVFDYEYHIQGAFFLDLYVAATGDKDRTTFVHIVQENEEPFEVLTPIPFLSEEFIELGRTQYRNALSYYAHCLWSNHFPGYMPRQEMFGLQIIAPSAFMADKCTQGLWTAPAESNVMDYTKSDELSS